MNDVTKKDVHPIPRVDDVLQRLDGMKYFTTLDLVQSYYQIEVNECDKEKTTFITDQGSFEYNVMPFGLTNAPSTFQRLMNLVLSGINWQMCLVYIDNILKSFDDHLAHIELVLNRLDAANLKLKLSKCKFGYPDNVYLGHCIGVNGIQPDPDKLMAIRKIDPSTWKSVTDVKSFLGMTGYYCRFVKDYASIAKELTELLKKDVPFVMSCKHRRSAINLREALCQAPT